MSAAAFRWSDASVRRALGLPGGDPARLYRCISTDTRTLGPGDVFVALEGDRFDGHAFVPEAVAAGCAAVVSHRDPGAAEVTVYTVPDTLTALGDLALHRREQANIPVVGITGSSGKTTVKDMTVHAVSGSYDVHGTRGNENNRVGVPLTILSMPELTTVLVLEMGTNEPGEIAELARIARPTVGVVTTVSEAHTERLKDLRGVFAEKLDLLRALGPAGTAIVGDEPAELVDEARALRADVAVCGSTNRADPELGPVGGYGRRDGTYGFAWKGYPVTLRIPGSHNVDNALLALAVARALDVPAKEAAEGVSAVWPGAMRGEVRKVGGLTLLVDCYNANPAGVLAAVCALLAIGDEGRWVAVFGTMLELGERSAAIHRETLAAILQLDLDRVILTGGFARAARDFADERIEVIEELAELAWRLPRMVGPGDKVLLKASRGVRLERVIPALEYRFGEA